MRLRVRIHTKLTLFSAQRIVDFQSRAAKVEKARPRISRAQTHEKPLALGEQSWVPYRPYGLEAAVELDSGAGTIIVE